MSAGDRGCPLGNGSPHDAHPSFACQPQYVVPGRNRAPVEWAVGCEDVGTATMIIAGSCIHVHAIHESLFDSLFARADLRFSASLML